MKRNLQLFTLAFVAIIVGSGCSHSSWDDYRGQLLGMQDRPEWEPVNPYGMVYIPSGTLHIGPSDQDVNNSLWARAKSISIQGFYMDDAEITNNEYRQFVYWVRDSIARRLLIAGGQEDFGLPQDEFLSIWPVYVGDNNLQDPYVNWEQRIEWETGDEEVRGILQPMFLPEGERFYNRKEIDTRKLNYEYYRIDIRLAASKSNRFKPQRSPDVQDAQHEYKKADYINGVTLNDGQLGAAGSPASAVQDPSKDPKTLGTYDVKDQVSVGQGNYIPRERKGVDRSVFIVKDIINVYPDTLAWVHDFTYSFNEPLTNM